MAKRHADGGYAPNSADRTIRPRRGLPSGRAVVGALLVTVAAVGAFAAASRDAGGPDRSYAVVARRVAGGTLLSAGDVRLEPMVIPPAAAAAAWESLAPLEAATATRDLEVGDLLTRRDVITAPAIGGAPIGAVHELALAVPSQRIVARTAAGDRVTVLATLDGPEAPVTVVAVEDAVVLGWAAGDGISGSGVLTLALDEAVTAGGLAHLALLGDITVIRTTRAIGDEYPAYFGVPEISGSAGSGPDGQGAGGSGAAGVSVAP